MNSRIFIVLCILAICCIDGYCQSTYTVDESRFILHRVNPKYENLKFFWNDLNGKPFGSILALKEYLDSAGITLVFAMNGGMYMTDQSPQGLYIEDRKILKEKDSARSGYGNFYLQPNGIFYLTKQGNAAVTTSTKFSIDPSITNATQSGPMLIIDGAYHEKFVKGSANLHIRNGVGILPDGQVLFAMSKEKVNFYDLATLFKQNGCQNALYLDGFVSRTYLPAAGWEQLDGKFGVIIGQVK